MADMDAIRTLAEDQHGVVSRAQCRQLGWTAPELRPGERRGEWERVSARVLRLVGSPRTTRAALMAAVLDAGNGAVASHRSAADLWQLPGFRVESLDVARPHDADHHRGALGVVHRTRSLPAHHVTVLEGIPVTTAARTLFDLAGMLHSQRTERAVDTAIAKSPAILPALHRMLPELAERGRNGITAMRAILDDRPVGTVVPASALEARTVHILREAGIVTRPQVDLGGVDWIGRVDLLVVGTRVVVEVDSFRFHTARLDRLRDARRDAELAGAGYTVVRVTEEEVWWAPAEVVRRVRAAIRAAA